MEDRESRYHTYGAGLVFENKLGVSVNKRMDTDMTVKISYERPIYDGLYLKLIHEAEPTNIGRNIMEASIGYQWGQGISLCVRSVLDS